MAKGTCSVDGCWLPQVARGWCETHYCRWKRHGDPRYSSPPHLCVDCGEVVLDSRSPRCSPCRREAKREYQRKQRAADPRREAERWAAYREVNPEKIKRASREWRERNPERVREVKRAYRARHNERIRAEERQRSHERRAQIRETTVEKFVDLEIFERDCWRCGICGGSVDRAKRHPDPMSPSLDHIIALKHGGPHTRANVQLSHLRCNVRKQATVTVEQLRLIG